MDEDVHIEMHREIDELGKFAIHMTAHASKTMTRDEAAVVLGELLSSIAMRCIDHGADLVGHIKAFLKATGGAMSASLIDPVKGPDITHNFGHETTFQDAELTLHVIVHGIWDPEVREHSLEVIKTVFNKHDLNYEIIKDYCETEKGTAHHGG